MARPKPQRIDTKPPDDQTYTFYPLETPNPIRLLYLEKDVNGEFKYTIRHADLNSNPRPIYNCLSYTWSYPHWDKLSIDKKIDFSVAGARSQVMTCDSQILKITPNLESALARIRHDMSTPDPKTGKPVPMWIDSLCIHQENTPERNTQVAKMDAIYRHAHKVIVWLGPEAESYTSTSDGVQVLERLSLVPEANRFANIPPGLDHLDIYRSLGIERIDYEEWIALGDLLMRSWFSRMWVIQETFEAGEVIVYCGEHELQWEKIVQVSETLTKTGLGSELMSLMIETTSDADEESEEVEYVGNVINNQWIFQDLRDQNKKDDLKLETLLKYARYFGATNHHDYVYAVRGMWKPKGKEMQRLRETIKPEYKLPVEDVFTSATYASIVEIGDLNMLCYVEDSSLRKRRERQEDAAREAEQNPDIKKKMLSKKLPSWVPDWSITPIAETLCMNPRPEKSERRWKASEGLKYTSPPEPVNKELHVKGVYITTIALKSASQPSFEVDPDNGDIFALLEFLADLLEKFPSRTVELIDTFWRTIIKDTYREAKADDEARQALTSFIAARVYHIENWVELLRQEAEAEAEDSEEDDENSQTATFESTTLKDIETLLTTLSSKDTTSTIPSYPRIRAIITDKENDDEFSGVNEHDKFFSASFKSAYIGRRLFHTVPSSDGGEVKGMKGKVSLGIGPESLEKGDQVWVIAGVDVPVILREASGKGEGKWRLVGECLVEGIIDGEGVGDAGERRLKEVVLI